MAIRIRKDGRIFCAALHPAKLGDIYIDDGLHYTLSVEQRILVTQSYAEHAVRGEWWWKNRVPKGIKIDKFYKEKPIKKNILYK